MTTIPTIDIVDALASEYADKSPSEILALALNQPGEIAISFSGAEDVVLIDMASHLGKPFRVFSLDTGRLHAETYQFIEQVRKHYNIDIEICFPEREAIENLTTRKGMFSFYQDGHQECCGIRKVQPLRKNLQHLMAGLPVSVKTRARVHGMKFRWFKQIQVFQVPVNS